MRKAAAAGGLAVGLLCIIPAAASAGIVVGKGIAGVKLGQTQAQVKARLGQPYQISRWCPRLSCGWDSVNYLQFTGRPSPVEQVGFNKAGRVIWVSTSRGNQQTARGIKVGSSVSAVRRAYPAAVCARVACVVDSGSGPAAITIFSLQGRRVINIQVTVPSYTLTLTLTPSSVSMSAPGPSGRSAIATISVTDEYGQPDLNAARALTITSSGGNSISPVSDAGGGRYTARILSTATVGSVTITASMGSRSGRLSQALASSATAVLTQT